MLLSPVLYYSTIISYLGAGDQALSSSGFYWWWLEAQIVFVHTLAVNVVIRNNLTWFEMIDGQVGPNGQGGNRLGRTVGRCQSSSSRSRQGSGHGLAGFSITANDQVWDP